MLDPLSRDIALVFLALVGLASAWGIGNDLRSGTSRMAHEDHESPRDRLPLNYWLGVGAKFAGLILAIVLALFLISQ